MAFEGGQLRARLGIPQPRGAVNRAGEDARPSGLKATLKTGPYGL